MKLLAIVSSLDLTQPFSMTPAWWMMLKGLYEEGADVLVTTYQGPAIESLWWRSLPNPVRREGDIFKALRDIARRASPTRAVNTGQSDESIADRLQRRMAQSVLQPRWRAFFDRTLTAHPDVDAVLFLTIPLNHLVGLPTYIRSKYHKPVFFYDGDVPASLPVLAGFHSGFKIYQGADVTEYDGFISNSAGGVPLLKDMGARAVHVIYWGVDPDVFIPVDVLQDIDVFFYGHSREYREEWIDGMIGYASEKMPEAHFAARGRNLGDLKRAELLPYLSFNKLREYACRSKINLCVTRKAHTSVFASSSSRAFELASLSACIISNPHLGIETWFEPGKEIIVIQDRDEAVERYRWLLGHDAERRAMGQAARQRVLKEHTFRHRAKQLMEIVQSHQ